MNATPQLLAFARQLNAAPAAAAHHAEAARALAFPELLTDGDKWLCGSVLRLRSLSHGQTARLQAIATKVERGRR